MTDIVGPLFIIALVFAVYKLAGDMDTASDTKKAKLELNKIDAETRQEETRLESKRLDLQLGKMVIEAKKLGFDTKEAEAEYKFLDEPEKP